MILATHPMWMDAILFTVFGVTLLGGIGAVIRNALKQRVPDRL